jgi:hypothetical protein
MESLLKHGQLLTTEVLNESFNPCFHGIPSQAATFSDRLANSHSDTDIELPILSDNHIIREPEMPISIAFYIKSCGKMS